MKIKSILKFIIASSIIICIYVCFILNIEHFTLSYNSKKSKYENAYYKSDYNTSILTKLAYDNFTQPTQSNMEVIKYNKIIRQILKKYSYVEDNQINEYMEKIKSKERVKIINNELMYIRDSGYELIFTLDVNNIEYSSLDMNEIENGSMDENNSASIGNREANKITNEKREEIYKEVKTQLQELGITEKFNFEPETIYIKEFSNDIEEIQLYAIEDSKNHIKIEIETSTYEIKKLQIGFENYKTSA